MKTFIFVTIFCIHFHESRPAGYKDCGREYSTRQFGLAAGDETYTLIHPWAVVFFKEVKDGGKVVHCSGSLLHPFFVITAGHCFVDKQGDYPPNPPLNKVMAAFGVDDFKNIDLTYLPIQRKKIKKVHYHKDYKYPSAYSDIAVVELEEPVTLSQTIYPICVADLPNSDSDSMKGAFATLVGYGPENDQSTRVNLLNQRILPQRRCAAIYDPKKTSKFEVSLKINNTLPDMFKDGLICADAISDKGSCAGDSGAPLMIEDYLDYDSGEKIFKLIAVLHGGIIPCDNSDFPAIFNRVAAPENYEWILNFTKVEATTIAPAIFFQCREYPIPIRFKCDGVKHCIPEGSDEIDCPGASRENPTTTTTPTTTDEQIQTDMVTLLVTGYPWSGSGRMEIIKENGETKTCPQSYDYPLEVSNAGGSIWDDGTIVICGGFDGSSVESKCYTMKNGEWQLNSENLITVRSSSGVSNIGNTTWVTGGYDSGGVRLSSTEIIHPNGNVTLGPDLPQGREHHCQTSYEDTTFIIGGKFSILGSGRTNTVMRFDSNNLNNGPTYAKSMVYERSSFACTIFKSSAHNGRPVVIAAGSYGESGADKAEIWDFNQKGTTWQEIGNLPEEMYAAKMTPTAKGDNVLLTFKKSMYTLSRSGSSFQWIKKEEDLSIDREGHLQFLVPSYLIPC